MLTVKTRMKNVTKQPHPVHVYNKCQVFQVGETYGLALLFCANAFVRDSYTLHGIETCIYVNTYRYIYMYMYKLTRCWRKIAREWKTFLHFTFEFSNTYCHFFQIFLHFVVRVELLGSVYGSRHCDVGRSMNIKQ